MTDAPCGSGSAADALLSALTRCLAAVGMLALLFTAVNVTLFATAHGVPWPIALLLDPMVALALATVLYADARLTGWGLQPPAWSAALRWFAGITATLMNTWTALWPDGRIGRPTHADPAAVLLHAVPPLLLILLTETVAAYRRLLQTTSTPTAAGSATALAPTDPCRHGTPTREHESATRSTTALSTSCPDPGPARRGPPSADSRPNITPTAPADPSDPVGGAAGEVFAQALRLDQASRTLSGRPVSQRRLRTELHLGPERAREIHRLLHDHHTARATL
jgi:hypothetical protein